MQPMPPFANAYADVILARMDTQLTVDASLPIYKKAFTEQLLNLFRPHFERLEHVLYQGVAYNGVPENKALEAYYEVSDADRTKLRYALAGRAGSGLLEAPDRVLQAMFQHEMPFISDLVAKADGYLSQECTAKEYRQFIDTQLKHALQLPGMKEDTLRDSVKRECLREAFLAIPAEMKQTIEHYAPSVATPEELLSGGRGR